MGGHGALTLYLKSLGGSSPYLSASAFAPISNPTQCPWGEKAFKGYLAGGVEEGKAYDASELIKGAKGQKLQVLVDAVGRSRCVANWSVCAEGLMSGAVCVAQGTGDDFYKKKQILPENLDKAARDAGFSEEAVKINLRDGYDHSYWFIQTFVSWIAATASDRVAHERGLTADLMCSRRKTTSASMPSTSRRRLWVQ